MYYLPGGKNKQTLPRFTLVEVQVQVGPTEGFATSLQSLSESLADLLLHGIPGPFIKGHPRIIIASLC